MTREQYLATVLDEKARGRLKRIEDWARCQRIEPKQVRDYLLDLIDTIITRGCEAQRNLTQLAIEIMSARAALWKTVEANTAAESRLAAVRELRPKIIAGFDDYWITTPEGLGVLAELDRILDDTPTTTEDGGYCTRCQQATVRHDIGSGKCPPTTTGGTDNG